MTSVRALARSWRERRHTDAATRQVRRVRTQAIAVGLACTTLVSTAWADGELPTTPGGGGNVQIGVPAGLNEFSFLTDGVSGGEGISAHSWALVESGYGLGDIDPLTGMLLADDVTQALSSDLADTTDLLATDQLALDAQRLAQQAKAEAEAKKRKMEEEARRKAAAEKQAYTGVAGSARRPAGAPQPWEVKNFSACGADSNASFEARIEVVNAFEAMCQAAERDGVQLRINSAYRDPKRQYQLFRAAVAKYGSERAARKWVAYSDGKGCSSRHCAGIAIDVSQQGRAGGWMHARVGCSGQGGVDLTRTGCGGGERSITRVQRYGFIFPMDYEPWHIELGLPITTSSSSRSSTCTPPRASTNPQIIGSVLRCRFEQAGITGSAQRELVAQGLVVSKCESNWNASAVVFGGRYVNRPHPGTGSKYSAAGLWQHIRTTAEATVPGGYANVKDPVASTNGAATLIISAYKRNPQRAYSAWACAMVNDGFAKKSVLPGYPGGPGKLPAWAYQY